MGKPSANSVNFYRWNRNILRAYWTIALLALAAEAVDCLMIRFTGKPGLTDYAIHGMVLPNLLIGATIGCAELANRFLFKWSNHLTIAAGTVFALILAKSYSFVEGIQLIYLLPLLASMFYFQKRKVIFSFVLNLCALLLLYGWDETLRARLQGPGLLVTVTFFIAGLILVFGIMSRGMEIQNDLIETLQLQQDLLVKNVIMDQLSKTDTLTGLYNHKTFHEYLEKLIEQAETYGVPLQLAILDIDNFKKVNDSYGHWVGDIILNRVAQTIRENVSADDFVARYGGEEFAVIFADKETGEAFGMCEQVREAVFRLTHEEMESRAVTVSIGLEQYIRGKGKERLFKGADSALYLAKRTGKNKTVQGEAASLAAIPASGGEDGGTVPVTPASGGEAPSISHGDESEGKHSE